MPMKKTITYPDGTTEVVEGTADELAEYESKVRDEAKKPSKGRRVLTEDRIREMLVDAMKDVRQVHNHFDKICVRPHRDELYIPWHQYVPCPMFPPWTITWCDTKTVVADPNVVTIGNLTDNVQSILSIDDPVTSSS